MKLMAGNRTQQIRQIAMLVVLLVVAGVLVYTRLSPPTTEVTSQASNTPAATPQAPGPAGVLPEALKLGSLEPVPEELTTERLLLRTHVPEADGRVFEALFDTYSAELDWLVSEVAATHAGMVGWREIAVLCATGKDVLAVDASLRRRGIPTQVVGAAVLLAQPAVIEVRSMLEVVHDPTANPAFVRLATGPRWRIDARDLAALVLSLIHI